MKKNNKSLGGLVYSTDPDFKISEASRHDIETLLPVQQNLRIRLDKKHRAGKAVTLIEGFSGRLADMEELGKKLKATCGTGGSIKDGQIIVQGDNRSKILQWLLKNGYISSKIVG